MALFQAGLRDDNDDNEEYVSILRVVEARRERDEAKLELKKLRKELDAVKLERDQLLTAWWSLV